MLKYKTVKVSDVIQKSGQKEFQKLATANSLFGTELYLQVFELIKRNCKKNRNTNTKLKICQNV